MAERENPTTESDTTALNSRIGESHQEHEIQLNDTAVYEGQDAEFIIKVLQESQEVSWFVDGSEATGDRYVVSSDGLIRKLVVKDTKLQEDGSKIIVQVGYQRQLVQLEVKALPWKQKLKDVTVYEGESATFSCEVTDDNSKVVWFVNDVPISSDDPYEVRSEGCIRHLLIREAKLSDTDMEITAKVGDQMTTAKVVVKALPWKRKLNDVTVYEGESITLSCEVTDEDLEVVWFVNDVPISSDDHYEVRSEGRVRHLLIAEAKLGTTDMEVTAKVDDQMTTAKVVVKALPWKRKLNDVTVYEGESVTLSCEVTDENLEVVWFVNDVPISSDDPYEVRSEGCVRHLLILETKLSTTDMEITAKIGDQMTTAKLLVKALPWKRKLNDVTVYEGKSITLSCEVTDEDLEVVWFVNDVPISSDDQYEVRSEGRVRHLLIAEAKLGTTDIEVTAKVDDQMTTAKVVVKVSHFSTYISDVMVKEGDTAVFSCEVRNVTDTVQWFVNGNTISTNDRYRETKGGTRRELRIHHCTLSDNESQVYVDISNEEREARLYVGDLEGNKRRWFTIGLAIISILCPTLRRYVQVELDQLYIQLENLHSISTQCLPTILKSYGKMYLRYKAINGNERHGKMFMNGIYNKYYDYSVKTSLDLANLFLPDNSPVITGFDNTCDVSAALNIISGGGLQSAGEAEKVRMEVRNPWGHCNLKDWDATKFDNSFRMMSDLVQKLSLSSSEQWSVLAELRNVKEMGINLFGGFSDVMLLKAVRQNVVKDMKVLIESMYENSLKKEFMKMFCDIEKSIESISKRVAKIEKTKHEHIRQHVREQFTMQTEDWSTDDIMFVPTQAAEELRKKIKEHNFVVVTGNSGTGKTFTVRHTALMMEKEGYIIVPAVGPEDIREYFKHKCRTVFVFDDLCGKFTLNKNYLDQWKSHKQSIVAILKDNCCKVIASCRLQVFRDNKMKDFVSELDGIECGLGSKSSDLSIDERRKIVNKYFGNDNITISDEKLRKFDFLPFLCSLLRNKDISELEKCFHHPYSFFKADFDKLYLESDDGKLKYCALILCVLFNNNLTQNEFKVKDEMLKLIYCNVLEECELSAATVSLTKMENAIHSLIDVYIALNNDKYMIIHDKLFDFIAKYFGEKMIDIFIEFADSGFIRERFYIESMKTSRNTDDCIVLPENRIKPFIERLITDWKKGEVSKVFDNSNMESKQFRQSFLSNLKILDEDSQRELVQKRDNDHGETPLLKICSEGDIEFARWIIDIGVDVNLGCNNNVTPLMTACVHNNLELVRTLLKYNFIDIDCSDTCGFTAFHLACQNGNTKIVKELIENSVDINKSARENMSPLMTACYYNHLEIVKELIECKQVNIDQSDIYGNTALYLACEEGNEEIVTSLSQYMIKSNMSCDSSNKGGWTPLIIACYNNKLKCVTELLKSKQIDIDHRDINGCTALYLACKTGNLKIVIKLIENKADLNISDNNKVTPFFMACKYCHIGVVSALLEYDVDINRSNNEGWSPLMVACYKNHSNVVKQLLRCIQIDIDKDGNDALLMACQNGNLVLVTELIKKYKCINKNIEGGFLFLIVACFFNHLKVVKELLKCTAINIDYKDIHTALNIACLFGNVRIVIELIRHVTDVNVSNDDTGTPLFAACSSGYVKVINVLMEYNVDVNRGKQDGWTPLMIASNNNHVEVVKLLLNCELIDVNHCADDGSTALYLACRKGNIEIVDELLQVNVDINKLTKQGWTPLMTACCNNHPKVVNVLLTCQKIDVNHSDDNGTTALHLACIQGNEVIVTELIKSKVELNKSKKDGWTPLLIACYNNHVEVVKLLLNCAVIDVNHCADDGSTALYLVCQKGNIEVVNELIKVHVDINKITKSGWTPLMTACSHNHLEVVKVLLMCELISINHIAYDCKTAFYVACGKGNVEIVTELMKCKHIDINHLDSNGRTAFYWACHSGHLELVRLLITSGVNINQPSTDNNSHLECDHDNKDELKKFLSDTDKKEKQSDESDGTFQFYSCQLVHPKVVQEISRCPQTIYACRKDGWFPLLEACDENQMEVVRELIRYPDIKLDQCNSCGQTALYIACLKSHIDVIAELIKQGVDVNKADINKLSPLHVACMASNKVSVKLLIDNGAKTDVRNNEGMTPLDIATAENDRDIIEILKGNSNPTSQ